MTRDVVSGLSVALLIYSLFVFDKSDAETTAIADKCGPIHGYGTCAAFSGKSGATVHTKPSVTSKVLWRSEYGEVLAMLEPAFKSTKLHAVWIPVAIGIKGPDGNYSAEVRAYVPRSQVILDTDFRRVTGCWPVKYIKDPAGGVNYYPGETYFSVNGVASYPHHPVTIKEYGEQEIYYADGIFTVRHKQYSNRGYLGHAVLDYKHHTVKFAGTTPLQEPGQVQWHTPNDLKGCKDIPTVDPDSRAPNPKDYRDGHG